MGALVRMSKKASIDEYFKRWESDLNKTGELLANQRYYLEGILVLSCYLGAFASMRFSALQDGEAYVKVVLEYSSKRDFYEQIDLLFLYQWPRSELRDNANYKSLKNHSEIVKALHGVYGSEDDVKLRVRYVSPAQVIDRVLASAISGFDERNFREKLPLFSLAELLYRIVRCGAVHNARFPFVNRAQDIDGNITYKPNHAITGQVLLETTQNVLKALWNECRAKAKWPNQL